jgi:hypothetical protein
MDLVKDPVCLWSWWNGFLPGGRFNNLHYSNGGLPLWLVVNVMDLVKDPACLWSWWNGFLPGRRFNNLHYSNGRQRPKTKN